MAASRSPEDPPGAATRRVVLMCLAQMLCMPGFTAYAAQLTDFRTLWGMTNAQAGLVGGALFLGYALAVPVLTSLTDRVDARRVHAWSALAAAAGSGLFALAVDGFQGALLAQALFGIGFAGVYMPGLKALTDRIPEAQHGRAVALYTSLSGIGLGFAYFASAWIAGQVGWRAAFLLVALGPVAASLIAVCALRPRPPGIAGQPAPGLLAGLRALPANRPAMAHMLGYAAHCWEMFCLRAWLVAFLGFLLASSSGGPAVSPAALAMVIAVLGSCSNLATSELVRRHGRRRVVMAVMLAGLIAGLAAGASWQFPVWCALGLVALYYAAVMADAGALIAGVIEATPEAMRGRMLGLNSMLGFAAGLVSPAAFGLALDLAGGAAEGRAWLAAFVVLALPNLLGILGLRRLARRPAPHPRGALQPAG